MALGRSTPLPLRSRHSPRRSLRDDERDDQRDDLKEGLHETWKLLTEALSRLNEVESNSASITAVVWVNPGFVNYEAVSCVATADHSSNNLPLPGILGNGGHSGNYVGLIRRSQRLAAKSQASYSLVSGCWQRPQITNLSTAFEPENSQPRIHP